MVSFCELHILVVMLCNSPGEQGRAGIVALGSVQC